MCLYVIICKDFTFEIKEYVMDEAKIKELFKNEVFVNDLFESKTYEEAQAKLADNGVELSVEDIKKLVELIKKKQAGELSDAELESVAGGLFGVEDAIVVLVGIAVVGTTGAGIAKKCGCL